MIIKFNRSSISLESQSPIAYITFRTPEFKINPQTSF